MSSCTVYTTWNISNRALSVITMADNPSAAWPVADEALAQKILDTVQQASHYRQLKKVNSGAFWFATKTMLTRCRVPTKPPRRSTEEHRSSLF